MFKWRASPFPTGDKKKIKSENRVGDLKNPFSQESLVPMQYVYYIVMIEKL